MSTKAVAVWLVIAVLLGSAAIYLLTRSSGPEGAGGGRAIAGARLVEFVPTDLVSIAVKAPDRQPETIRRSPDNAEWEIVLPAPPAAATPGMPSPPAGEGRSWPLLDTRVQSFLTLLAETRIIGPPASEADVGAAPTTLRLTLRSGRVVEVALAERTIGGTGLARVSVTNPSDARDDLPRPVLAVIDDRLHQVLRTPGPRAWRDQSALRLARGGGASVSRLALDSSGRELELGRIDGRWSVRKPLVAPADPAAVDRLVRTLSQVSIVDFLDGGPGTAATGLSQPTARIRLEHDQRSIGADQTPRTTTLTNELVVGSVGGLGSAGADRLFARIDLDRIVLVDGKTLADLRIDPGSYVWPHPSIAVPPDIGTILMEVRTADGGSVDDASAAPRVLRRNVDRWSAVASDGSTVPMLDTQLADVNRLIAFLTGVGTEAGPGAAHIGAAPPARFVPFGRVALLSIGSAPLEQIEIGEAGRGLVAFRTGEVFRTYPEDRLPRLIADLRARAKAAGVPIEGFGATGPEGREPVK